MHVANKNFKKEHILVIGGSGLVGSNVVNIGRKIFKFVVTSNNSSIISEDIIVKKLDITNLNNCSDIFKEYKPISVVLLAAYMGLKECELNPKKAIEVNALGTRNIVKACKRYKSKLIYLSTDMVFDGIKKSGYSEEDIPNPINVYGKSKLEGERSIYSTLDNWVILRSSNVYGFNALSEWSKGGFIERRSMAVDIINKLKNNENIRQPINMYQTPIFVEDLARIILFFTTNNFQGIFHIGGEECISRYKFSKNIGTVFNLDTALIKKMSLNDKKIPKYLCLNIGKIKNIYHREIYKIFEGLQVMKK